MYKNMTYQQARRIRNQSISSVLADQLIMGAGYGAAIKQTASAKFNAKLSGIKEKFDPLNIIKFMTGGSRLGPAILGKMLGRSRKDIEYFTGQARPVQYRGPKIGKSPSGEGGEGLGAAGGVLRDILTLLQKTHDDNMNIREKENNLLEGRKHEEDRRHNDLMKALGSKGATATPVKTTEGNSIFDNILKTVQDMIDSAMKAFEWVKSLAQYGPKLLTFLSSPLFLGLLGMAAAGYGLWKLADYFAKNTSNMKALDPTEAANILRNGSQRDIDKAGGREALTEIIKAGPKKAEEILSRGDQKEIIAAGGEAKLKATVAAGEVAVPEARDAMKEMAPEVTPKAKYAGNGLAKASKEIDWDKKFGAYYDASSGKRKDLVGQPAKQESPAAPAVAPAPKPSAPPPVTVTPKSAEVSSKTRENLNLGLDAKVVNKTDTTTNNNVINNTKNEKRKIEMPSVRNPEETFARLIYNSTRVV